ncbi:MAG: zinc ribbon domain-containing protein [Lachnospiraceae bacterium]|nr:zinc ribbon domain-containing protein [Lachnospiraceae bacterium]
MKCEYCGNNLGIEDEKCPYCGKENRFASKHNKDMDKYEADYASVKEEVLTNSRRFNGLAVRITVIAVLLAVIAGLIAGIANKYEIQDARRDAIIKEHLSEYKARLAELSKARDYTGLFYYCRANRISYSRFLDEYYIMCAASSRYTDLRSYIFYLKDEDSYVSDQQALEGIAEVTDMIYEYRDPKSEYDNKTYYNDEVYAFTSDLADEANTILKAYFGFSDEDIVEYEGMTRAHKELKLEEGLKNVKQDQ